jgi:indolepyruvate ferredoxin oxidoreductase
MVWGTQQTNLFPAPRSMACSACGTARARAWTAAATCSSTPTPPAPRSTAACWRWPATTTPAAPRPCRTARTRVRQGAMMPVLNPAGVQDILDLWACSAGRCRRYRALGRLQDHRRNGGVLGLGRRQSVRRGRHRHARPISRCRRAASTSAGRIRRWTRKCACTATSGTPRRPSPAPTASTKHGDRLAARGWASSPPARATSTCCRRSNTSASTTAAAEIGIRVYKVGMTWPLEPRACAASPRPGRHPGRRGKAPAFIEYQMKEQLYNWREAERAPAHRRQVRRRSLGDWMLPSTGELTPATIAGVIAGASSASSRTSRDRRQRLKWMEAKEAALALPRCQLPARAALLLRLPAQHLDQGAGRLARAGRHRLPLHGDLDGPQHATFTHMGGEGVPWVGQAPFTDEKHVFQNLGDGTYFHSGCWRSAQAVAAGQHHLQDPLQRRGGDDRRPAGGRHAQRAEIARQVRAEGVKKHRRGQRRHRQVPTRRPTFPPASEFHHRDELDAVQREAARSAGRHGPDLRPDLRRREAPPPQARQVPRPAKRVCSSTRSAKAAATAACRATACRCCRRRPSSAASARSTRASCNKDYSCVKGFCPSFVTVHGGALKAREARRERRRPLRNAADADVQAAGAPRSPGTS